MSEDIALARKVADAAYFAAAEFLSCVAILHAGNDQTIVAKIEKRNGGKAFDLIKKAMFVRVLFGVMIPFDPSRRGDYHLRVGVDLIRRKAEGVIVNQARADEALERFDALEKDPAFEKLRQIRNKEASHLSKLDDKIERATIGELLTFANNCGPLIEAFVAACGLTMPSVASQVHPYAESSTAFFSAFDT
jgi:hypothetical protein